MPGSTAEGQVSLQGIRRLVRWGLLGIGVAIVGIIAGLVLREQAETRQDDKNEAAAEQARAERRASICNAIEAVATSQEALIAGNEAFLVELFSPSDDATPAERAERLAEIEEGRLAYHARIDPSLEVLKPALKECGQRVSGQ